MAARTQFFPNIPALRDAGVPIAVLEKLADADAFRSVGLDRRQALWEVSALADRPTGMFTGQQPEMVAEQGLQLPLMSLPEHVIQDYKSTSLSLKTHPVSFVREQLDSLGAVPNAALRQMGNGGYVKVAGLVLVRQRPGTANGICFITLEDETGIANVVVFRKLFQRYRREVLQSRLLMVEGQLQVEGEVIHVIVRRCHNVSGMLRDSVSVADAGPAVTTLSRADEQDGSDHIIRDARVKKHEAMIQGDIFHPGRNFR